MNQSIALSIKQMEKLASLGLDTSDASMCYVITKTQNFGNLYDLSVLNSYNKECNHIPAYTLQDILNVIERDKTARYILSATDIEIYLMGTATKIYTSFAGNNPLDYAYNALVWCIKNGYVKTNKV